MTLDEGSGQGEKGSKSDAGHTAHELDCASVHNGLSHRQRTVDKTTTNS